MYALCKYTLFYQNWSICEFMDLDPTPLDTKEQTAPPFPQLPHLACGRKPEVCLTVLVEADPKKGRSKQGNGS